MATTVIGPIIGIHDITDKTRSTEPEPQAMCAENLVKFECVVPEICMWTDRHVVGQWLSGNVLAINTRGLGSSLCSAQGNRFSDGQLA